MASLQARRASRLGRQRLCLEQMGGGLSLPRTPRVPRPACDSWEGGTHLLTQPQMPFAHWGSWPHLMPPPLAQLAEPVFQPCCSFSPFGCKFRNQASSFIRIERGRREQTPPPFSRRKDGKWSVQPQLLLWWENPKETSWKPLWWLGLQFLQEFNREIHTLRQGLSIPLRLHKLGAFPLAQMVAFKDWGSFLDHTAMAGRGIRRRGL